MALQTCFEEEEAMIGFLQACFEEEEAIMALQTCFEEENAMMAYKHRIRRPYKHVSKKKKL